LQQSGNDAGQEQILRLFEPPVSKAGRLAGRRIRPGLPHLHRVVVATLQAESIFLVKAFFESAAEEAARVVLTNQTETLTVAQFQTEVCNQLTALFTCAQVTVELEPLPTGTTNLALMLPAFDSKKGNLIGTPPVDVAATAGFREPTCRSWSCIRRPFTAVRSASTSRIWATARC
jgi:hypothetical protein